LTDLEHIDAELVAEIGLLELELADAHRAYQWADDVKWRELDEFCDWARGQLRALYAQLEGEGA
jgi:hypothetical protein